MVSNPTALRKGQVATVGCFCWEGDEITGGTHCACISRGQWLQDSKPNAGISQLARVGGQACSLIAIIGH